MSFVMQYPEHYDAIVIGGGHAACEAAWALSRRGHRVLMACIQLDAIGQMSCNPSIGGIAKGHLAKEVDALGGLMGRVADRTAIQYRILNASKGPSVRSSRLQCDVQLYRREMLRRLWGVENIALIQATIDALYIKNKRVLGVVSSAGVLYRSKVVLLCSGTFMRGLCHIGEHRFEAGRAGDGVSSKLSLQLMAEGLRFNRFKTGTPARLSKRSLDLSRFELQYGDAEIQRMSFYEQGPLLEQQPCFISYTTEACHALIRAARERSPMFNGSIQAVGARYCPSIEDKVFRFADKERHQIFIEPVGLDSDELYPAGISSSLPFDVQMAFLRLIPGFERVHVIRPAYAVEYDCLASGQLRHDMSVRGLKGLYFAGQVNGTSGYEEAAAQGLMAGINAALYLSGDAPFILRRDEAYIGVMIDDLVMREIDEPYRMFTSRAEFRLSLREDNADQRLSPHAHRLGLLSDGDYAQYCHKMAQLEALKEQLSKIKLGDIEVEALEAPERELVRSATGFAKLLKRPELKLEALSRGLPQLSAFPKDLLQLYEIELKFSGYIAREAARIESFVDLENRQLPEDLDYDKIRGLSTEILSKLKTFRPRNLAEAKRISGMTPAALNLLYLAIRR